MSVGRIFVGLAAVAVVLAPQPVAAQTPTISSNVTIVNVTGEVADVVVDEVVMTVPDSAAAPAFRLHAGAHDITVSTSVTRADQIELGAGCSALWILVPASEENVVFADEECPPARATDESSASVRVINAAPNAASITLAADERTTSPSTRPWNVSPRLSVPAGRVQLDVLRADRPGVIRSTSALLRGGTGYAAILAGGGEQRVTFLVVEDAGRQPPEPADPAIPINMGFPQSEPTAAMPITLSIAFLALVVVTVTVVASRRRVVLPLIMTLAVIVSGCGALGPDPARAPGAGGDGAIAGHDAPLPPLPPPRTAPSTTVAASAIPPPVALSLGGGEPLKVVSVPAAGLGSPSVLAVGEVGWVSGTNVPGDAGMAMLAGHTTFSGRGAFAQLGDLAPGNRVQVARTDGSSVSYVVSDVFEVPKNEFPTEVVYAPTSVPLLVLVTCSGPRSPVTQLHELNLVVIATLVS